MLGRETRPEEWDTGSYQIGWLEQTLSCRWGLVPASVITIRKYKLLGFEMPRTLGLTGQAGGGVFQQLESENLRISEMYKMGIIVLVPWGVKLFGANLYGDLCKRLSLLGPSFPFLLFIITVSQTLAFSPNCLSIFPLETLPKVDKVQTSGFATVLLQKAIPLVSIEPNRGHSPFWQKWERGRWMWFLPSLCVFP